MTLREFIEQEISCGRISCIEDFGESLDKLESDIEWADIKINYSHFSGTVWYEIELAEEEK